MLLSREVSTRLNFSELKGKTVTLKIKYSNMKSITRSETIGYTNDFLVIYNTAVRILENTPLDMAVRLIGVTVSGFEDETDQLSFDLSGSENKENTKLKDAIFDLHKRFGTGIIKTANEIKAEKHLSENNIKSRKYQK